MTRPEYNRVDNEDKLAQLSSRTAIISKSFVTDLWMKVLHRAIDDIVLYTIMRDNGVSLKEEELEFEQSAHDFLFNSEYRIPMDDYSVVIVCCKCKKTYEDRMSILSANNSKCSNCQTIQDEKTAQYTISTTGNIKDISLEELLALWDINDIDGFRAGTKIRIQELITKKKQAAVVRAKTKDKENNKMTEKSLRVIDIQPKPDVDFQPPSEVELTDFDKAIIKVLDDTKIMLMAKNRKYGNSATKPVRAFSKADPEEQIKVRIDDKISRLIRSRSKDEDEDVVKDLIGYLVILAAIQRGYIR